MGILYLFSEASLEVKDNGPEHWAKRRNLFKDSKQWSSVGGSSITSSINEESGRHANVP